MYRHMGAASEAAEIANRIIKENVEESEVKAVAANATAFFSFFFRVRSDRFEFI